MTPAHDPVNHNLTPFSVIIAEQPFQAMVYAQLSEPVSMGFRSFRKGFRLRVTKDYDPEVYDSDVHCRFTNLKTQRNLERFIIPQDYKDHPQYAGFSIAIRWGEFLASFKVRKVFSLDDLDYSNADHIYVAVRQYLYDRHFPIKIPEHAIEEIIRFANASHTFGDISREDMLKTSAKIACDALGVQE